MSNSSTLRACRCLLVGVVALVAIACGSSSPTRPSEPAASTALPAAQYTAPPAAVSSVMPAALAATDSTQTIIVVGTNFKTGLTVDLTLRAQTGGLAESSGNPTTISGTIQSVTDTCFEASVKVPVAGTYDLRVTNPSAPPSPAVTVPAQVNNTPAPTVVGISPASPAPSQASQVIVVTGTNFQPGLNVALTGPAGVTMVLNGSAMGELKQTAFSLTVTLGDTGTYKLRASNPSGQMSEPWCFTVKEPSKAPDPPAPALKPTVAGTSPATPTASSSEQLLYFTGTNFDSGLTATLTLPNGTTATFSGSAVHYFSSTSFKISVVLAAGNYTVRVANPSGQASEPYTFTVKTADPPPPPAPKPTVTGTSPSTPIASASEQLLYFTGTNFAIGVTAMLTAPNGATLTFAGPAVHYFSSTSFKISVALATAGAYTVRVANPGGLTSEPYTFTVKAAETLKPTVTGTSPSAPTASATEQLLYFVGTSFDSGLTATLTLPNGTTSTFTGSAIHYFSSTSFKISVVLAAGSYTVRVVNPSGQTSEPYTFTVSPAAKPTVTGTSPATPTASASEQLLYFTGTNFESGLTATLTLPNGTTSTFSGSAIHYFSSTSFKISVVLAAGSYTVRVVNPSGQTSEPCTFTVKAAS